VSLEFATAFAQNFPNFELDKHEVFAGTPRAQLEHGIGPEGSGQARYDSGGRSKRFRF
jgi:hypothetical protein